MRMHFRKNLEVVGSIKLLRTLSLVYNAITFCTNFQGR